MSNHLLCKDLVHYPIETTICIINGWSSGSKNDGFYVMDENLLVIVEEVVIRVGGRWATYLCLVHGWCWPEARPSWDDCCLLFADFILRWHGTFHDFSHSWISPPDFDTHFWGSVSVRLFNENLESFCETWQAMSRTSLSYLELDALVPQGDKWKIRWTNWDDDDAIQYMFQKTETSW